MVQVLSQAPTDVPCVLWRTGLAELAMGFYEPAFCTLRFVLSMFLHSFSLLFVWPWASTSLLFAL
jgi:hypothetical protein